METRKHSGWLEIAYQNLIPTFCWNLWLANVIKKYMTKRIKLICYVSQASLNTFLLPYFLINP